MDAPIDDATYAALDWTSLIGDLSERHLRWSMATPFFRRSRELEAQGEPLMAQALQVLGGAISMHMRHASHATFGPAFQMDGQRSMSIEDLGEHDIALLARAAHDAPDPWLRARFADLAVSADGGTPPDWRLGQLAVESYLDYASSVFGTDWAIDGIEEIRRGLLLLRVYAKRDETLKQRYWDAILAEMPHAIERGWPGLVFRLCDEAKDRSREACETIAPLIDAKARELDDASPFEAARWHEQAQQLKHRLGLFAEANASLMAQGEAMARSAEHAAVHQPLLAPMHLTSSIGLLRRAKAPAARIQVLRDQLAAYERASLDHYGHSEVGTDVTDWIAWIDGQLEAQDFFSALLHMAYRTAKLIDVDELERRVRANAQQHPLSHMFGATVANADGMIVAQRPPLDLTDADSVRQRVISDAAQFDLELRASVMVKRAVEVLYTTYQPSFAAVKEIVEASLLTPSAQGESIARGLFAGFTSDWLAASVYLIPAMEPFVRFQLKRCGAHTTALDDDGTQREKTLGELLEMDEAERFFGKNLIFELRAILVERDGFNLRNAFCHGLIPDDERASAGVMDLWWLLWRILLFPWHRQLMISNNA